MRAADAMSGQRALFEARTVSLKSQIAVLQDRIDQQLASSARPNNNNGRPGSSSSLIQREVDVKQTLFPGAGDSERGAATATQPGRVEGTLGDLPDRYNARAPPLRRCHSSMRQIEDQRLQDVSNDMREARSKLNEIEDKLRAAKDVAMRRDVVAPEDGTILSMRVFNVGAVVKPGDTVMELVPSHDRLVAHVKLSPNDIDVVYPGLNALIRLPAFKQRLVPSLRTCHLRCVRRDHRREDQRQILQDADLAGPPSAGSSAQRPSHARNAGGSDGAARGTQLLPLHHPADPRQFS